MERISFRYPEDPERTLFSTGNYQPIFDAHRVHTRTKIKELGNFLLSDGIDNFTLFKAIDDFKKRNSNFHSNTTTNSYTCAEQAALDFLCDQRVVKNLQDELNVDAEEMKGVIVNVHCSHTPCHSCATALGRESQRGGVFQTISKGKPVFVVASCQRHYQRPSFTSESDSMIPYKKTKFLEGASLAEDKRELVGRVVKPTLIDIKPGSLTSSSSSSSSSSLDTEYNYIPYPVVLMSYSPEVPPFNMRFEIDQKALQAMVASHESINPPSEPGDGGG